MDIRYWSNLVWIAESRSNPFCGELIFERPGVSTLTNSPKPRSSQILSYCRGTIWAAWKSHQISARMCPSGLMRPEITHFWSRSRTSRRNFSVLLLLCSVVGWPATSSWLTSNGANQISKFRAYNGGEIGYFGYFLKIYRKRPIEGVHYVSTQTSWRFSPGHLSAPVYRVRFPEYLGSSLC